MSPNDYIIAQMKDTKPFLAQVKEIDVGSKTLTVIPDLLRYKEAREVELSKKDVLVRLGPDPKPGKVYGVDVSNVYRKSFIHDTWGPIHFFVRPDKAKLKQFKAALDSTAKKLEKLKLTHYMGLFETEVRAQKGKWAGMYQHRKEQKHLVWYALDKCEDQSAMEHVIVHEYGHVLRFNGLTRVKLRARWQKLFQQSIAPIVVSKKTLDTLLSNILDADAGGESSLTKVIKDFVGDDDDQIAAVRALSRWMKQVHHISPRELEVLWSAEDKDTVRELWPKSSIDTSKLKPVLTDYSTKNVEELFAESFMFYALGLKLPAQVERLLEKSLTLIRDHTP